jgi:Zn-dependent M28 family amino/carboxypeptidase
MKKAIQNRLYSDVKFLTELRPFRNYQNLDSLKNVVHYIKTVFLQAGLEVKEQKWMAMGNEYTNVIGIYNSQKSKRLVVGAHYDVAGDQPGADDNASAVAGLLETVRLIGENKPELDYAVEFVAYCLEEPPFFGTTEMGSYVHAKSLYDEKVDVIGMICYEMIGYFSDEPNSQTYPLPELASKYPSTANFIIVVGIEEYEGFNKKVHKLMSENSAIDVQVISFENGGDLAGMSDQRNYWKFGYQALMINDTSFIRNPHYHNLTDTIDTLDFPKMTEVINGAYNAIVRITVE